MRSLRCTWVLSRQDWKAVQEESAALVASVGEAEQARWTVWPVEAWNIGKVDVVWTGLLSIQRGMGEVVVDMVVVWVIKGQRSVM